MRIIFFNIWHGIVWDKLASFLNSQKAETDVFGLVEVDENIREKLIKLFPEYDSFYYQGIKTVYLDGLREGRAVFIKKENEFGQIKHINLFKKRPNDAGGLSLFDLKYKGKMVRVGVVHGKARPGSKVDTPLRLIQSQKIVEEFSKFDGPKILGGDFNLNPDGESIRIIEKAGFRNLIREYKIKTTRNQISWDQFASQPGYVKQYFADYCFVSKEVEVKNFTVPNANASDHEPLILDFEI